MTGSRPIPQMCIAGRWAPAIPVRGPIDVRGKCKHEWTPHVFSGGHMSSIDYDCLRCGTAREFGAWPDDGPDPIRRWIARKLRWPWVIGWMRLLHAVTGRHRKTVDGTRIGICSCGWRR